MKGFLLTLCGLASFAGTFILFLYFRHHETFPISLARFGFILLIIGVAVLWPYLYFRAAALRRDKDLLEEKLNRQTINTNQLMQGDWK